MSEVCQFKYYDDPNIGECGNCDEHCLCEGNKQ